MEQQPQGSEVARMRERIELELRSAQSALSDPAITAPHRFIEQRYRNIGRLQKYLGKLTSEEEALRTVIDISNDVIDPPTQGKE